MTGNETPAEYDKTYLKPLSGPLQIRIGRDVSRGTVSRFVVQLEYRHEGTWVPVVRYDHDQRPTSSQAHDVTVEGLHMDVFRDGEKIRAEYVSPPIPAGPALDFAEDHLAENLEVFIRRFERWHEIETKR